MYSLVRGHESEERIDLLLQLTKITSAETIAAVKQHLCTGWTESDAAYKYEVEKQNLNRAIKKLNKVASVIEQIKEMDWPKYVAGNHLTEKQ